MSDWPLWEALAATTIVLLSLGSIVSIAVAVCVKCLEWIEAQISMRRTVFAIQKKDDHPYHDAIKTKQESDYSEWLDQARDAITKLSLSRESGIVSSDDVWDICPPPAEVEPRAMGAIWQPRDRWQKVGYVQSRRHTVNHRRPIMQWRYMRIEEMREAAE